MRVIRIGISGVAISAIVLASACNAGASQHPDRPAATASSASTNTSGGHVTSADFCNSFKRAVLEFGGNLGRVAAARRSLPRAVAALRASVAQAPASIRPDVEASVRDWAAINTYMQTKATQHDLDSDAAPAAVAGPLADWGQRTKRLRPWLQAHCGHSATG
jgi:hypothetical protein